MLKRLIRHPAAQALLQDGLSLLQPDDFKATLSLPAADWQSQWPDLAKSWDRLPPDTHLRDGGHYRHRRHACYVQTLASNTLQATPHRAHWQPTDYNALHGGFERWFEPVEPTVSQAALWTGLLLALGRLFERWGVAQQIASRIVQAPPGVPVGSLVARGEVALGFQQLSELLPLEGITIAGPLPPAIQINTVFSAGVAATCSDTDAARRFIDFMASDAAAAAKRRHGMEPA